MQDRNVEIVRSLYEAFRTGDNESPFDLYDEDIVWDMRVLEFPDGQSNVVRGHQGVRSFWRGWLAAWRSIEFEMSEPVALGDSVIVEIQQRNRGRTSGAEIEVHWFQVWTLRAGKVVASYARMTRHEALEAAGIEE